MNAYLSKEVRKKYRATWQEEFIVGMNPELPMGVIEAAQEAIAKATGDGV